MDNQIVPSGVEPLSLGPGPKRIAATLRDYAIILEINTYKICLFLLKILPNEIYL